MISNFEDLFNQILEIHTKCDQQLSKISQIKLSTDQVNNDIEKIREASSVLKKTNVALVTF